MSQPSIKKNYIFKLAYQILAVFTPLITAPYVSRVLGADGIGMYSYSSSIMSYFTMFAALGTALYGTREIAQCRNDKQQMSKVFWEIEIMTMGTTLIALFIWFLFIVYSSIYRPFFIALIPVLFATMFDISWLYTGLEKIHYTVIWNTFCKILGLILLFSLVKEKEDAVLYVFITSIVTLIGNISMWIYLPREVDRPIIKNLRFVKHIKQTLKYFITSVAISIYTVLDKTMLGYLTNDAYQSGYYEQANKIINIVKPLAFTSINDVMLPRMSFLFANNNEQEIKERIENSISMELFLTVGCCFGIIAVADNFVPIFFGPGYEPVSLLLKVMSVILIPICLSTCTGSHFFVPSGHIIDGTKLTMIGSSFNLIINIPLIIFFQSLGAVIASIAAETIIGILYVYKAKDILSIKFLCGELVKKCFAGIIMLLTISIISEWLELGTIISLIVQIIIGACVYTAVLLLIRDNSIFEILSFFKEKVKKNG